jgi:hypothetical protein
MDKGIGRPVLTIKGSVSANNYADYENVSLPGRFLCVQLKVAKAAVATLHLEAVTTRDVAVRITVSTLYDEPRFLGRSLRLPLRPKDGWTTLVMDMDDILTRYCNMTAARPGALVFQCIKRVQVLNCTLHAFVVPPKAAQHSYSHAHTHITPLLLSPALHVFS